MTLTLSGVSLIVRDYDEALDYYVRVLGFSLVEDTDLGNGKRWVTVSPSSSAPAAKFILAKAKNEAERSLIGMQHGGRVGFFLETTDFGATYLAFQEKGVTFCEEPRQEKYATVVIFQDLYGNKFDLICRRKV